MRSFLSRFTLLGGLALIAGCSDEPTEFNFKSLTLTMSASVIPINGTVDVTARLADLAGQPVPDGTTVTFYCCSGDPGTVTTSDDLGTITPAEGTTVDGNVTARFTAKGRSGTARISARSTGAGSRVAEVLIGSAAATKVTLTAEPGTVPLTGGTIELAAVAVDSAGRGVGGVPVTFTTNVGTLATGTVSTDNAGRATVRLTTTRETIVTASIGTAAAQNATLTLKVTPTPTIAVTVNPISPVAGQAAQFTYTLGVPAGSAALRDLSIDFGDNTTAVSLTGVSPTTFVGHVFDNPGTYVVRSTVGDAAGVKATSSLVIVVLPRPVMTVSIDVPAAASLVRGLPIVLGVTVTPTSELPRVVRYEWDFGDGETAVVTSGSVAHVFLLSGTKLVRVTVVTTDGQRITAQTAIVIKDG